jgi:hypothetical protein
VYSMMSTRDVVVVFRNFVQRDLYLEWIPPLPKTTTTLYYGARPYSVYTFEFTQFPGIKLTGSDACTRIEMHGYVDDNTRGRLLPCIRFLDTNGSELCRVDGCDAVVLRRHLLYFITRADGVAHDLDVKTVYEAFLSYLENSLKLGEQWPFEVSDVKIFENVPVRVYRFDLEAFHVKMTGGRECKRIVMNGSVSAVDLPVCISFRNAENVTIGEVLAHTLSGMYAQLKGLIMVALPSFALQFVHNVHHAFCSFLEKGLQLRGPWPEGSLHREFFETEPSAGSKHYAYDVRTSEFKQWHGFAMSDGHKCVRITMHGPVGEADTRGLLPTVNFIDEEGKAFVVVSGHTSDELYSQLSTHIIRDDSVTATPAKVAPSSSVVVAPQKDGRRLQNGLKR